MKPPVRDVTRRYRSAVERQEIVDAKCPRGYFHKLSSWEGRNVSVPDSLPCLFPFAGWLLCCPWGAGFDLWGHTNAFWCRMRSYPPDWHTCWCPSEETKTRLKLTVLQDRQSDEMVTTRRCYSVWSGAHALVLATVTITNRGWRRGEQWAALTQGSTVTWDHGRPGFRNSFTPAAAFGFTERVEVAFENVQPSRVFSSFCSQVICWLFLDVCKVCLGGFCTAANQFSLILQRRVNISSHASRSTSSYDS